MLRQRTDIEGRVGMQHHDSTPGDQLELESAEDERLTLRTQLHRLQDGLYETSWFPMCLGLVVLSIIGYFPMAILWDLPLV